MKNLKYTALTLFLAICSTACQDDPELQTTDIGPDMNIVSADASGVFGGKVGFEVTMSDRYALSTLKAQVFFDDDMVAEETIRTKENGTYEGFVALPFFKDIPDGDATLRFVGQNVRFGLTTVEKTLIVKRPRPDYLTFVLGDKEYRMDPTETAYEYAVTAGFPQKPQGCIVTPALDGQGTSITFGYDSETNGIVAGSTDPIPFTNSHAGEYTITFNLFSFAGSPFTTLQFDQAEMTMSDEDNYYTVANLTKDEIHSLTGIADFADWDIDRDFFERKDPSVPEDLTFRPMSGLYKVTANFKHKYLKVEAMRDADNLAVLKADGTGDAIWAIGDTSIGKPTTANGADWNPEQGGLCMARIAEKKFQLTLVSGQSVSPSDFDFKLFWQKTWDNGEFRGKDDKTYTHPYGVITTQSDLIQIGEAGNIKPAEGKKLDLGGVYRFTVDVSAGTMAAVLTVEKVGEQQLPPADLQVNGQRMEQVNASNYKLDLDLKQGQKLTFGGADAFLPAWIDDNFLSAEADGSASVRVVDGRYRIRINLGERFVSMQPVGTDGSDPTTAADGTGGLWLMGWGVGGPSQDYQFGFTPGAAYCMAELSPAVYVLTGKAGPAEGSVFGQYFCAEGISLKYFFQNGWGGEMKTPTVLGGLLKDTTQPGKDQGNLELNGVKLEENALYELKIDLSAGRDKGVVSFTKK